MSQSLTFSQASISFKNLLDNMHESCNIKDNLIKSWENGPDTIQKYKKALLNLPKELRKRERIKIALKDIESFESDIKTNLAKIKGMSFQDFQHAVEQKFKTNMDQMAQKLVELEQEPIIQKFLRGEQILSSQKNIQWGRKLGHALFGLTIVYTYLLSGISKPLFWSVAGVFVLTCLGLETTRHINPAVNNWVCRWFRPVMREREKAKINSAMFYIFSIVVVYLVFPIHVTALTILFLALGDPVASIVGISFGKTKISQNASLEGSLACFGVCTVTSILYVSSILNADISTFSLILFSLLSGLTAALAEKTFKKLDDNLVMPLLTAPALWILMKIFF